MLSSIHPLGERARNNRWGLTVAAFTLAAVAAAGAIGAALGLFGRFLLGSLAPSDLLLTTAALAGVGGVLDLAGATPPGPERQVNETWIGVFRGWVYGGGFGLQLGAGFLTYIVTWGVFATLLAEILTVSPFRGAIVGAVFGLGRSLTLMFAGYVDRPSRLTVFNRALVTAGPTVRRVSSVAMTGLGAAIVAMGLT